MLIKHTSNLWSASTITSIHILNIQSMKTILKVHCSTKETIYEKYDLELQTTTWRITNAYFLY